MEPETTSILNEINAKLDAIQRSTAVLADVVNPNIGIERIWPNREVWADDQSDGLVAWKKRVCQAKNVAIVSNTLWTSWFQSGGFRHEFFESLTRGNIARILIYDPYADVLILRATDERDPRGQMQSEIGWTLELIARGREELSAAARKNLQVRLTTHYNHVAQIIRADDHILVAVYLSGKSGGPSPTFQLRGSETAYFRTYSEQIEILWERGRIVSDNEFHQIVAPLPEPTSRVRLYQFLINHFSEGELRDLCFYVNVDYENLPGERKGDKARELILHFERHDRVLELVEKCRQLRPKASWGDAQ
jgi:hypothetical protein